MITPEQYQKQLDDFEQYKVNVGNEYRRALNRILRLRDTMVEIEYAAKHPWLVKSIRTKANGALDLDDKMRSE